MVNIKIPSTDKTNEISFVVVERYKNGKIKNTEWWTEEEFTRLVERTFFSQIAIDTNWWYNMPKILRSITTLLYHPPRLIAKKAYFGLFKLRVRDRLKRNINR